MSLADDPDKRSFLINILGAAGLLPLLGFAAWPILGATLLEIVWSGFSSEWSFGFHYAILPSVAASVAAVYGLARLSSRKKRAGLALIGSIMMVVGTVTVHVATPSFKILTDKRINDRPTRSWNAALELIPGNVAVSASDAFVPRLAERDVIYRYPRIREAQWVVLDSKAPSYPFSADQIAAEQSILAADTRWTKMYSDGTLTIFMRNDTTFIPDRANDPATRH